jgi:hypothetical protein
MGVLNCVSKNGRVYARLFAFCILMHATLPIRNMRHENFNYPPIEISKPTTGTQAPEDRWILTSNP